MLHVCIGNGALVAASGTIPDDPSDYLWTAALTNVGCNRLHCMACRQAVVAGPARDDGGRDYRCACAAHRATTTRWLAGHPDDAPSGLAPADWGCAGHAPRRLPLTLDGVVVAAQPDWHTLVEASVDARLGESAPSWLPSYPNAWLERLVATVTDDERRRFAVTTVEAMTGRDARVRTATLDIAERLSLAAVGRALAALVATGTFDWSADATSSASAVEHLRRLAVSSSAASEDLTRALREALRHGPGGAALVFVMAPHDADWLVEHAVELNASLPRFRARLLSALEAQPEAQQKARQHLDEAAR